MSYKNVIVSGKVKSWTGIQWLNVKEISSVLQFMLILNMYFSYINLSLMILPIFRFINFTLPSFPSPRGIYRILYLWKKNFLHREIPEEKLIFCLRFTIILVYCQSLHCKPFNNMKTSTFRRVENLFSMIFFSFSLT